MRRALILGVLLAAALAPAAQARPSLVVESVAKGYHGGFEQMNVQFQCGAADVKGASTYLTRCSFGTIYAKGGGGCFECVNPPVVTATGSGNVRLGMPYDLCVTATSYVGGTPQTVSKCAAYSYLTNTAVIAG
jgi:hypothetical protein